MRTSRLIEGPCVFLQGEGASSESVQGNDIVRIAVEDLLETVCCGRPVLQLQQDLSAFQDEIAFSWRGNQGVVDMAECLGQPMFCLQLPGHQEISGRWIKPCEGIQADEFVFFLRVFCYLILVFSFFFKFHRIFG